MRPDESDNKVPFGLTLSGGGLRGIGHIGAIKALEAHGISPTLLSGTSAGAIIAAFYAAGYTPDEMLSVAVHGHFFTPAAFRLRRSGIFNTGFLLKMFTEYLSHDDFAQLKHPLYVAATDIMVGTTVYFHEGPLHQALLASASIPFIFPQVTIDDKTYLDGGIMNNLPVEPIRPHCNQLIAVHVNSIAYGTREQLHGRKLFDRVLHLALGNPVYEKAGLCDLFIDPPGMTQFSMFDKKNIQKVFDHTYDHTMRLLETNSLIH